MFWLAVVFSALLVATADAQIKQWTDEKGVVHFGNPPQPPRVITETIQIKVRKSLPFIVPPNARDVDVRRSGEAYLRDLLAAHSDAEGQWLLLNTKLPINVDTRQTSAEMSAAAQKRGEILRSTKAALFDPIRSDFLSFERVVKDRNAGALPEWVKDNREWRVLDKEFSR